MMRNFKEEKDQSNEELIKAIQNKHSLWTSQAVEALLMFTDVDQYERVACSVMSKIQDRHNRF